MHTLQFLLQGVEYQGRRYKLGVEFKTDGLRLLSEQRINQVRWFDSDGSDGSVSLLIL